MTDWLEDFVKYASSGPISERMAYWVGVSTVAAALRRKVYIDNRPHYEWSPNFYILIVGPTGVMKNTAIAYGFNLLRQIDGINLGPGGITWQSLIQLIAQLKEDVVIPGSGEFFEMSCVTIGIGEFGVFFDPMNRELRDNLTNLWDSPRETVTKMTKTSGTDDMVNPWINLIAGTTPGWLAANFNESMVRDGFANRIIYLFEKPPPEDKDNMFPPDVSYMEPNLINGLNRIAQYAGEMCWSPAAREFLPGWFSKLKSQERALGEGSLEAAFVTRKHVHMGKLAMVIAASHGSFPTIELEHVQEAIDKLEGLECDTAKVLGRLGQAKVPAATRAIVEAVQKVGSIERRLLYREQFMRTLTKEEFRQAVDGALEAELIMEMDGVARPVLMPR